MKMERRSGFTLIELVLVMAIIALLSTLLLPVARFAMEKARSTACVSNLRQIGISFNLYVADHNNIVPKIETNPNDPVYSDADEAKTMLETFGPYGVNEKVLKCPEDAADTNFNYYAKAGTSYMWRPMYDGSDADELQLYTRGGVRAVPLSRARLVIDAFPVHFGQINRLYADGRVKEATARPK